MQINEQQIMDTDMLQTQRRGEKYWPGNVGMYRNPNCQLTATTRSVAQTNKNTKLKYTKTD